MAERRMFTKKITDSDSFIEMSSSTQALYFHLNQGADDDGFNNQIQMAMFRAHASIDDLKVLIAKNFVIRFESGVIVIKHWRMHNTIRKDRYNPTNFREELAKLNIEENGSYSLADFGFQTVAERLPDGCQMVAKRLPQDRIGKDSIDKDSIDKDRKSIKKKHKYGSYEHVLLSADEHEKLNNEFGEEETNKAIEYLDEYIEMKGYKAKSHYLAIRKWVFNAVKEQELRNSKMQRLNTNYNAPIDWDNV